MNEQFDAENVAQRLPVMRQLLAYLEWDGPLGTDPGWPTPSHVKETVRVLIKRDEAAK